MVGRPFLIKSGAFLLMAVVGGGLYFYSLRSDFDQFKAMLEEVMPGYILTSEIIDRELIVASTFAGEYVQNSEYRDPIDSRASSFVSQYNGSGLPPLTLLFVTRESGLEYWELEFQGCSLSVNPLNKQIHARYKEKITMPFAPSVVIGLAMYSYFT